MALDLSADARIVLTRIGLNYQRESGQRIKLSQDGDIIELLNQVVTSRNPTVRHSVAEFIAQTSPEQRLELIRQGARLHPWEVDHGIARGHKQPFSDLYVSQLIGLLSGRRFNGKVALTLGATLAQVELSHGTVVRVDHPQYIDEDAVAAVAWQSSGSLELLPHDGAQMAPRIAYGKALDKLLGAGAPDPLGAGSLARYTFLTPTTVPPDLDSPLRDQCMDVMINVKRGAPIEAARGARLSTEAFAAGLLHLTGNGNLICSYAPTIGKFLDKFQGAVTATLGKQLGPNVARAYVERVDALLDEAWPGRMAGIGFDPIYGTAPYKQWAVALESTLKVIGSPALTMRSYQQARKGLDGQAAALMDLLAKP